MRAAAIVTGLAAASLAGLATAGVLADSITMRASETVLRTRVVGCACYLAGYSKLLRT